MKFDDSMQAHLTEDEHILFKKYIDPAEMILEFGSGGSTVYYFQKEVPPVNVVSVESSVDFMEKMKEVPCLNEAIAKKKLHYLHGNVGPTKVWGMPVVPHNFGENYWKKTIEYAYYTVKKEGDLHYKPDVIFIDGRYRVACALYAIFYLQNDYHILIHDYQDREKYHIVELFLDKIESSSTLAVFKKKSKINYSSLLEILSLHGNYMSPTQGSLAFQKEDRALTVLKESAKNIFEKYGVDISNNLSLLKNKNGTFTTSEVHTLIFLIACMLNSNQEITDMLIASTDNEGNFADILTKIVGYIENTLQKHISETTASSEKFLQTSVENSVFLRNILKLQEKNIEKTTHLEKLLEEVNTRAVDRAEMSAVQEKFDMILQKLDTLRDV